jgi:hypothetical protein
LRVLGLGMLESRHGLLVLLVLLLPLGVLVQWLTLRVELLELLLVHGSLVVAAAEYNRVEEQHEEEEEYRQYINVARCRSRPRTYAFNGSRVHKS